MGKWNCTSVQIVTVTPQGHLQGVQFGHMFQVDFQLQYTRARFGTFSDPYLEWNEQIVTFTQVGGAWQPTNVQRQNMYARSPGSNTFFGWRNKYNNASYDVPAIKAAVPRGTAHAVRDQVTIRYLKGHTTTIPCSIVDTPMLGKGTAGRTERRIIYFNLGIREGGSRNTATQILEINGGNVTIMKVIAPGYPEGSILANDPRLQQWRNDFGVRGQYR